MDGGVSHRDDFAALVKEGGEFVEDGLVDDVGLEEDEGLVAFGGEGAVGDEEFVEDVEFAEVAEGGGGFDGRLEIFAEAIKRGGAINGDFGFAGFAGEEVDVFLDVGGVFLELVAEELGGAGGGVGEHASDEGFGVEVAGGFGAFFDAVELVGGAHPFVGEDCALAIRGLEDDVERAGHFGVAGAICAPGNGIDAASAAAGFHADFFGGKIFEDDASGFFGEVDDGLMIPGDEIEPATFGLRSGEGGRRGFGFGVGDFGRREDVVEGVVLGGPGVIEFGDELVFGF